MPPTIKGKSRAIPAIAACYDNPGSSTTNPLALFKIGIISLSLDGTTSMFPSLNFFKASLVVLAVHNLPVTVPKLAP